MKLNINKFAAIVGLMAATTGLLSSSAMAWSWSGMVRSYNKTSGSVLTQSGDTFYATSGTNVVFVPEGMGPNAHHFTLIAKNMNTGSMVWGSYRTMVSRWSMENPTSDGSLGYTYQPGAYWLQVNAYQHNGVGAGSYYAKLIVN